MWHKRRYWGWYLSLLRLPWFCIKILKFYPEKQLSRQMHEYRKELWFVLWGKGEMYKGFQPVNGSEVYPGAIQYIPRKVYHQLKTREHSCYVLELQWGSKVKEDDIVRIEQGGVRHDVRHH